MSTPTTHPADPSGTPRPAGQQHEPSSGMVAIPVMPLAPPGVQAAAMASKEGRAWLGALGMASAPQFLALLVVVFVVAAMTIGVLVLWRMDGVIRNNLDYGLRQTENRMDEMTRRMENCESRHTRRDQEDAQERSRQYERDQSLARERERTAEQFKTVTDRLGNLNAILVKFTEVLIKINTKLPDSPGSPKPAGGGLPDVIWIIPGDS